MGIILINATQLEEIRVALVENNRLTALDYDGPPGTKSNNRGSVYKALITRIEPSLGAVFVNYGGKRQGFLPFKEIAPEYFNKNHKDYGDEKPPITALLREGQELLVQVDKEERGNKGAALTTFITLAGRYLVLINDSDSGGISRRIEGEERDELKETLNALALPQGMGLIIRTAGVGKNQEELQMDLDMLCNQWTAIRQAYANQLAPCLIHQEGDVIIRSIRDNLRKSISEIIIDDQISYVKAKHYIEQTQPDFLPHLKLYNSPVPLFNFYQIESQIETAYQREVILPSGGALVIDRTEALVSIDINSAKATSGQDIEATALNTNLEAADEIARQLRLRDLGGLVVIDFIDMSSGKNQREVENRLKEALKTDRARIQIGRISRFGLLEMSRQRLRLSLGESVQEVCPRCEGRGTVRNIQSHALSITRLIEEEALKEKVAEIQVQLPVEMATFVMNEKRDFILSIEKRHSVHVVIIANPYLSIPQYNITRIKEDNVGKNKKPSYSLIQRPEIEMVRAETGSGEADEPAVKSLSDIPAAKKPSAGFMKTLWRNLFGNSTIDAEAEADSENTSSSSKGVKKQSRSSSQQRSTTSASRNTDRRAQNPNQTNRRRRSPTATAGQQRQPSTNATGTNPQRRRNPNTGQSTNRTAANKTEASKKKETEQVNTPSDN